MKKVVIYSSSPKGKIRIPCSKSDAHRKIIAASLCLGQKSVISNVDISNDIRMTIEAMKSFASIKEEGNKLIIEGKMPQGKRGYFDAGESGSTLRFLIPLFSYYYEKTEIKGSERLLQRPLSIYQEIYEDGLKIDNVVEVTKSIKSGHFKIKGDVSSQFISGLLFVLPLLPQDSYIKIIGKYESKSYVNMTIDTLKLFNIDVKEMEDNILFVRGNQKYIARDLEVEGDYSQAAFFACLGAINGEVEITGLKKDSLQGDKKIVDYLSLLGAKIIKTSTGYIFKKSKLRGTIIDLNDTPDLGPVLMSVAPLCEGTTKFVNTKRLRIKESDRVKSIKEELAKFKVILKDYDNEVLVTNQIMDDQEEIINPHNDHRILMAISIISTLLNKTIIEDVECVNKSYPNFFKDLFSLGIKGEVYDN